MATLQTRPDPGPPHSNSGPTDSSYPRPFKAAWWKWGTGLLMAYVIYGAFFIAGGAVKFTSNGDSARIVFFHVPVAVSTSLWYFIGMIYAVRYLFTKSARPLDLDAKSAVCMELGFLSCILATITGSLFAKAQWGQYWNWDPRETSIVVMLLLYAAYLVLRGATATIPEKRARFSAVYALLVWVPAFYLIWIVPRVTETLHPVNTLFDVDKTSPTYKMVLYPSFIAFIMLFVWLFQIRLRLYRLLEARKAHLIRGNTGDMETRVGE